MKRCPFCAEEIQDAAIKCKHCGEFLDGSAARRRTLDSGSTETAHAVLSEEAGEKWYFRKISLVLILGCVGPLGLPLIWWHPKLNRAWKIGLTVLILLITWLSVLATIETVKMLQGSYNELMQTMNSI
jgi:hypothetical protein